MVIDTKRLPDSSFRNFPFLFVTSSVANKGRKTVTHEYTDSDVRFVEDLGADNDIFTVNCEIDYSNDFSLKESFINILKGQGSGLLILPTEKAQEVTVVNFNRDDSRASLGITNFNITFNKSEENRFPQLVEGSSGLISSIKDEVLEQNNSFLSRTWSSVKNSKAKFDAAVSKVTTSINEKSTGLRKLSRNIQSQTDGLADLTSSLNSIVQSVNTLVQTPSQLANSIEAIMSNFAIAYDNAGDTFDALKQMFGFNAGDTTVVGDGGVQTAKLNNQTLINNFIATSALAQAYEQAINIDFSNTDELNSVNSELEDGFLGLDIDLDDDIFQNLLRLREESNNVFRNLSIGLPIVTTLNILNPRPLAVFVQSLYGNLDKIDDIAGLNNFTDTANISGDIKTLSDV